MKLFKIFGLSLIFTFAFVINASAQLTGPKNIPGDYPTLALAVADLNAQGVGVGGVTFNLAASETAPLGGYVIGGAGSAVLGTASAANPIVFNGGGNTVTAATPQASGVLTDSVFKLIGADWVTIQNFTMLENPANTTTALATNNMTEFGVALFYVTSTDGAQDVTIQNNTIALDRTYPNTFGIYSNSTHSSVLIAVSATGLAGGNSRLKVYGNNITDVNMGVMVVGPTPAADQNEGVDIGGAIVATGNTITNFGTANATGGYASIVAAPSGIQVKNARNFNVSFNTVTSSNGGNTGGTLNGIQIPAFTASPTGAVTQTINNNTISLRTGLAAGIMVGINCPSPSSNSTSTYEINNNDFNNFGNVLAGTGSISFIIQANNPLVSNINGNTFTNNTVNTTGAVNFVVSSPVLAAGASLSVSGNSIVTQFTRTSAGTTTVWNTVAGSSQTASHTINNNNFSNITLVSGTFNGIIDGAGASGAGPVKSVNGNTFNNIITGTGTMTPMSVSNSGPGTTVNNNTIGNITSAGAVTGLTLGVGNQAATTASGNVIGPITSSGATVTGIATFSVGAVINGNKVFGLNGSVAGSVVRGIAVQNSVASSTLTLSNNLVGSLTTPIGTSANGVIGIDISGSAIATTYNVFHNTVYLNNGTSGAGFGSSGISAIANATARTSVLDLRNNIIVNTSVQNGAGLTVAYRRTAGGVGMLANYAATSDNNNFFAGTPGPTNVIYSDGTSSAQTMVNYRNGLFTAGTVGPRDSVSISENPTFLSTVGPNANFLHINPAVPTQIESGGAAIAGITDDFDGDMRNAGFPDIGADEFAGIPVDLTPPAIAYPPFGNNTALTTNRTLNVTITDPSGVAFGGFAPRVYFKKATDAAYVSTQCGVPTASVYPCTIDHSLVGGGSVTVGNTIQYFVVAQDALGNVGSVPSAGFAAIDVNTVTSPPAAPNTYSIVAPFPASVTVGATGTYTSLTNAGGLFAAMNAGFFTGDTSVNVISSLAGELGTVALNRLNEEGALAGTFTVTIQPSGGLSRTILGTNTTALINLSGADRVTINGLNTGGNSLLIRNTSVTTGAVIQMINDASNNSILNTTIEGGNLNGASSALVLIGAGISTGNDNNTISGNTIRDRTDVAGVPANLVASFNASVTATNSFNTVSGNQMINFQLGAFTASAAVSSDNWNINNNDISQTAARATQIIGISTGGMAGTNTISGNLIHGFNTSGAVVSLGMLIGNSLDLTVSRNRIFDFQTTAGATGLIEGIEFNGTPGGAADVTLVNNMITLAPTLTTPQTIIGIQDFAFAGNTYTADFNSVYVGGTASGAVSSWAMRRGTGAPTTHTARSNIAYNDRTGGAGNHFASGDQSANTGTYASDFNFFAGTGSAPADFMDYGSVGAGTLVSFAAWKAGPETRDASSIGGTAAGFTPANIFVDAAAGDLHLFFSGANPMVNGGTPVAGVLTDFDGQTRQFGAAPDLGADELVPLAAGASLSGRITTADGRGIRNVIVVVSGGSLTEPRIAQTGSMGWFTFTDLQAGETYIVSLSTKRYTFAIPVRVVSLTDNLDDVDFVAEP